MKQRILIDVDSVQADFTEAFLGQLTKVTGRPYHPSQVTSWDFGPELGTPAELDQVWAWMGRPGVVEGFADLPYARESIAYLRAKGHQCIALTAPRLEREWLFGRVNWLLARGFTRKEIVLAHDKSLVVGDWLVDDHHEYANDWAAAHPNGIALLFDSPWNRNASLREGVVRAYSWYHVVSFIDCATQGV